MSTTVAEEFAQLVALDQLGIEIDREIDAFLPKVPDNARTSFEELRRKLRLYEASHRVSEGIYLSLNLRETDAPQVIRNFLASKHWPDDLGPDVLATLQQFAGYPQDLVYPT